MSKSGTTSKKKQETTRKNFPVKNKSAGKWLPAVFFLLAFLVYANTLRHQYTCDDGLYTYQNSFVQKGISSFPDLVGKGSQAGSSENYAADYRPVVLVNLALEKTLFGGTPGVYHFFNVLIYALLCSFLFTFLKKIFNGYSLYVPVLITALFVLHPLHTEVVASIKSRDELLCMVFGLLSLHYIYLYATQRDNIRYLVFSCVSFFLSFLSKESGYSYLGLIPLLLYFFTEVPVKKIARLTLPFVAIAVIGLLIRMSILHSFLIDKPLSVFDNSLMAATNSTERLATGFTMLLHAFWLLVVPLNLSWDYSVNQFPVVNWSNATALLSLVIHLGLLAFAIAGIKKKNIFSFAVLFYFISFFITSNLAVKISSSFGERFLFAPSLAFCIALTFLLAKIFKSDLKKTSLAGASKLVITIAAISLLYAFKTIDRNNDWKNNFTLYSSGVETSPNSARAHFSYANEFRIRAESASDPVVRNEAAKNGLNEFQKGLNIYSVDTSVSIVYYNMGILYYATGNSEDAIKMYQKALELKPAYSEALNNTGVIYFMKKDYSTALTFFKRASECNTGYVEALANMGACYQNLKDNRNAIEIYEKVLKINPGNRNVIGNLSALYDESGDTIKANYYRAQAPL